MHTMTRRQAVAAFAGAGIAAGAKRAGRIDLSRISAITDEVGTTPVDAIAFARTHGIQWLELRAVPGYKGDERGVREYAFLSEGFVKKAAKELRDNGLGVSFLNTSLLKFALPGMEPAKRRLRPGQTLAQAHEAEKARFDRRREDLRHAIRSAHLFEVDRLRIFTGFRVAEPDKVKSRVADLMGEMSRIAEREGVWLLVENEGACNVATSSELAALLKAVRSRALGINWDPYNDLAFQETPFPDGYSVLPKKRIGNIQVKGRSVLPDSPTRLDWPAILRSLEDDGYDGKVGLETHIFDDRLIEHSHNSMREIRRLVAAEAS